VILKGVVGCGLRMFGGIEGENSAVDDVELDEMDVNNETEIVDVNEVAVEETVSDDEKVLFPVLVEEALNEEVLDALKPVDDKALEALIPLETLVLLLNCVLFGWEPPVVDNASKIVSW